MPATILDPKTALVVIDLQKGLSKYPTIHPIADVVANTKRLADAFRAAKQLVVLVNVAFSGDGDDAPRTRTETPPRTFPSGPEFYDLIPELGAEPSDLRITKRQPNAFYGTELDLQLRRRKITGIVLVGISTSSGVESTARAAHELVYNITFAIDAITDVDPAAHEYVTKRSFPRFGEVDTTDAIIKLLPR